MLHEVSKIMHNTAGKFVDFWRAVGCEISSYRNQDLNMWIIITHLLGSRLTDLFGARVRFWLLMLQVQHPIFTIINQRTF